MPHVVLINVYDYSNFYLTYIACAFCTILCFLHKSVSFCTTPVLAGDTLYIPEGASSRRIFSRIAQGPGSYTKVSITRRGGLCPLDLSAHYEEAWAR